MTRPLIITDCDEVLLHMIVPFRQWLDERHDVHLDIARFGISEALRRKACGTVVEKGHVWDMLREFFTTEMHRQKPISGALEALQRLSALADIVVLTNIEEAAHQRRIDQLGSLGITFPVHWNQGGKGKPLAAIVAAHRPSVTLFIDDLAQHHESVTQHAPEAWRLHMVGEPELAPLVKAASSAHARIDQWSEAEEWIMDKLQGGGPAIGQPVLADHKIV